MARTFDPSRQMLTSKPAVPAAPSEPAEPIAVNTAQPRPTSEPQPPPPPPLPQQPTRKRPAPEMTLQGFVPPQESLEWRLGQEFWSVTGLDAFTSQEVPNLTNNDGMGSRASAQTLFANCAEAEKQGLLLPEIIVVEIGIGLGLHARLLLDHFKLLCEEEKKDWYDRLVYLASDISEQTLEHIHQRGILQSHGTRLRSGFLNANDPTVFVEYQSREAMPLAGRVRAVICNYVLDVLPFDVLQHTDEGWQRLHVRTLLRDMEDLPAVTPLKLDRILELARRSDRESLRELLPLQSFFRLEDRAFPMKLDQTPLGDALPRFLDEVANPAVKKRLAERFDALSYLVLSHGAIRALDALLGVMMPLGFIVWNDYGPIDAEEMLRTWFHQRFGRSTAMSINYPLVEWYLQKYRAQPAMLSRPPGDDDNVLHARCVSLDAIPETHAAFAKAFDRSLFKTVSNLHRQGLDLVDQEKFEEARELLMKAHQIAPYNWHVLAALGRNTLRHSSARAALGWLQRAVQINPVTSADLWNDIGDAFYTLREREKAWDCYMRALQVNPSDARTYYNMSWILLDNCDHKGALEACGRGLALDNKLAYRQRLLRKQQEILEAREVVLKQQERRMTAASRFET